VIPISLKRFCPADPDGRAIGVVGILRDSGNWTSQLCREPDQKRAGPGVVSDLEGKILQANDAVFALLGFRPDELIEQSLSALSHPLKLVNSLAALREVVERGVTRNARLNRGARAGGHPHNT